LEITRVDCLGFVPPIIRSFHDNSGRGVNGGGKEGTYEISKTLGLIAMNQTKKAREEGGATRYKKWV